MLLLVRERSLVRQRSARQSVTKLCRHAPLLAAFVLLNATSSFAAKHYADLDAVQAENPVLWTEPADSAARDLFYGPGGKEHEPHGPFTFVKEDLGGTNPKFVVKAADGVKWKVKLGLEARPETVAAHIVWAAGFYASENYFVRDLQVAGLPRRLHRGQSLVAAGGTFHNVRLKREPADEKKTGTWQWKGAPFAGSHEWNGLRVLMSLINNWDLKDENNAVFPHGQKTIYMVSDLGASFGSGSRSIPKSSSKDSPNSYRRSKFIRRAHGDMLDFYCPAQPALIYMFMPKEFITRVRMQGLAKNVPRADAKWLGQLLARLSDRQIRDAFRGAGYDAGEVELMAGVLKARIAALTHL